MKKTKNYLLAIGCALGCAFLVSFTSKSDSDFLHVNLMYGSGAQLNAIDTVINNSPEALHNLYKSVGLLPESVLEVRIDEGRKPQKMTVETDRKVVIRHKDGLNEEITSDKKAHVFVFSTDDDASNDKQIEKSITAITNSSTENDIEFTWNSEGDSEEKTTVEISKVVDNNGVEKNTVVLNGKKLSDEEADKWLKEHETPASDIHMLQGEGAMKMVFISTEETADVEIVEGTELENDRIAVAIIKQVAAPTAPKTSAVHASAVDFSLFPNPAQHSFTAEIDLAGTTDAQLTVTDSNGKTILSKTIAVGNGKQKELISTANWASGIYFIAVSSSQGVSTQKLIVE